MFEVEYLWNGWAKKDEVSAEYDWPIFGYPH